MTVEAIAVFQLAEKRLAWLAQRQEVLAQNVANANTPGFRARDVSPFQAELAQLSQGGGLAGSDPAHFPGGGRSQSAHPTRGHERAPDGNAISLEDQLAKVADTASSQELVSNLFRKYQGFFRIALGRS